MQKQVDMCNRCRRLLKIALFTVAGPIMQHAGGPSYFNPTLPAAGATYIRTVTRSPRSVLSVMISTQ